MPIYKIHHITKYKYDRSIRESANQIKIYPYNKAGQEILSHEMVITDEPNVNKHYDYWGNTVGCFTVAHPRWRWSRRGPAPARSGLLRRRRWRRGSRPLRPGAPSRRCPPRRAPCRRTGPAPGSDRRQRW